MSIAPNAGVLGPNDTTWGHSKTLRTQSEPWKPTTKNKVLNYNQRNRGLTTWLSQDEAAKLRAVAKAHNLTVATFLRALAIDALADEKYTLARLVPPDGEVKYYARLKVNL